MPPPDRLLSEPFLLNCWQIWTTWNKLLFENRASRASDVIVKAISGAREWQLAQLEDNRLQQPSSTGEMHHHLCLS